MAPYTNAPRTTPTIATSPTAGADQLAFEELDLLAVRADRPAIVEHPDCSDVDHFVTTARLGISRPRSLGTDLRSGRRMLRAA
jgi:hypothetical protein